MKDYIRIFEWSGLSEIRFLSAEDEGSQVFDWEAQLTHGRLDSEDEASGIVQQPAILSS